MISPVQDGNPNEHMRFKMNEPVVFRITLLNTSNQFMTMNTVFAINQCSLLAEKRGDEVKRAPLRFEFTPVKGLPTEVPLPSNAPVVIGAMRLNVNGTDFVPGQYLGTLQRQLALPPPSNDVEKEAHH